MKRFLHGFSVSEFRQVRSPHGFSCYLHLTFLSSRNNQIADIAPAGIPCMGMRAGRSSKPALTEGAVRCPNASASSLSNPRVMNCEDERREWKALLLLLDVCYITKATCLKFCMDVWRMRKCRDSWRRRRQRRGTSTTLPVDAY